MILDIRTAAMVSGVRGHVLRQFIREGLLPAQKFGGGRYILNQNELNAFLVRYRSHEFDGRYGKNKHAA